ncbi:S-adenosyl-L-methionine-dependent methyltransferase [Limtongia smithiae]|uniref:S-adenosyl-L-methionine-dependent methyltransferase n=1 Tax=Limtongia smithiae TaxID=1125753 RepID=UPI0034CF0FC8
MRIPPSLKCHLLRTQPLLLPLLRANRSLSAARSELRWLTEHFRGRPHFSRRLAAACLARAHYAVPLQYILGSQPFGCGLDIRCRRGVLIPRWETEEWGIRLARHVRQAHEFFSGNEDSSSTSTFTVLDICTGSGCVALLMAQELVAVPGKTVAVSAFDVSPTAIALAKENLVRNAAHLPPSSSVCFKIADLFQYHIPMHTIADLVVANPPYISLEHYTSRAHTARSVRVHEPKLALVGGVEFYTAIFDIAWRAGAGAIVSELADEEQFLDICDALLDVYDNKFICGAMRDTAGNVRTIVAYRADRPEWAHMRDLFDVS